MPFGQIARGEEDRAVLRPQGQSFGQMIDTGRPERDLGQMQRHVAAHVGAESWLG